MNMSIKSIKETQSKMKNLGYDKFVLQKYLEDLEPNLARNVIRVRVADFSDNFKGQGPPMLCSLCGVDCAKIKEKLNGG